MENEWEICSNLYAREMLPWVRNGNQIKLVIWAILLGNIAYDSKAVKTIFTIEKKKKGIYQLL